MQLRSISQLATMGLLAAFSLAAFGQEHPSEGISPKPGDKGSVSGRQVLEAYGKLPLSFEANGGQSSPEVKFLTRGLGYALFLTRDGAVLSFQGPSREDTRKRSLSGSGLLLPEANELLRQAQQQREEPASVLYMQVLGANPAAKIGGADELPGKTNYFIGNDPKKWRPNLSTFAKVQYRDIYPGVDLVYYGNQGRLEYDFVIAPGAASKKIRLQVAGKGQATENNKEQNPLRIDTNGDLVVATVAGEVRYQKPVAYQIVQRGTKALDDQREVVDGHFVLKSDSEVGFEVGSYDATRPLIIDPTLVYSTFLTGNYFENGNAIAVDSSGYAYVTGVTFSSVPTFPVTPAAYQQTCGTDTHCNSGSQTYTYIGNTDAFVTKMNLDGSNVVWSTYLGGSYDEQGKGIAVDSSGNVYVAGYTRSSDFPTTTGAFQTTCAPYVTSPGVPPTCPVFHLSNCGGGGTDGKFSASGIINAFVTKLNSTGTALVYSTFVGGTGNSDANGLAVDAAGEAYIVGHTDSSGQYGYTQSYPGCPLGYANAHPTTPSGFMAAPALSFTGWPGFLPNGYLTVLSADGKSLVYSTYLGSTGPYLNQATLAVAVDSTKAAYVTGYTNSPSFPTTTGAFQTTINQGGGLPGGNCGGANCLDAFVAKFDPSQSGTASLVYSTFLGGSGNDLGTAIAVDSAGNAYVAGQTNYNSAPSPDFPTTAGAFQSSCPSPAPCQGLKGFVTKLNAAGSAEVYSSYLGGTSSDGIGAIALDSTGRAYVTGSTNSVNFPSKNGASLTAGGGNNAFVSVFKADGSDLDFSGRLGGSAYTFGVAIALDPSENIYLTGYTLDQNFPTTAGAFQTTCTHCGTSGTNQAAFVTKISALPTNTTSPLTITADNESRMYGAANPTLLNVATGLLNGDTLASLGVTVTCATAATATSPVGNYPITCSGPSSASNYTITYQAGSLSIAPAPLTIAAGNASRVYGAANPVFAFTPSGLINGDTLASIGVSVTCSTTATASSPVSGYAITCSGLSSSTNYSISYQAGTLTITPATLTITAYNATKILDAANPAFTATYNGFVSGDTSASLTGTLSCATTATTTSPIGSYPITCSGQSSANYNINYVPGTLKISYASGGIVDGNPGHQILSPINADGTSVYKQGKTVPAQFRVGDANGVSIGTPGVVTSFFLTAIITGTVTTTVDDVVDTNNPDMAFRWDSTNQQWIFNITTKNLSAGSTYVYTITLNDGSTIIFQFGLR